MPQDILTTETIFIRVFLALAAGLLLGLDRQIKNKPGDFRTNGIVSAAAALLSLLSLQLFQDFDVGEDHIAVDPGRIIQGILMGIGFLGAGVIIHRSDNNVVGTATGATIWASGALGLVIGFGYLTMAAAGFIAIFLTLTLIGWLMPTVDEDNATAKKKTRH